MAMDASSFPMGSLVPMIVSAAQQAGVDPNIALAHFVAENTSDGVLSPDRAVSLNTMGKNPDGSNSGAVGLFQVVGRTLQGLKDKGLIPKDLDYNTLQGQIQAGVAAVKDAHSQDNGDPFRGAALYANGQQGLQAYDTMKAGSGTAGMPAQLVGYLPKFKNSLGTAGPGSPGVSTPGSSLPASAGPGMRTGVSVHTNVMDPALQASMVGAYNDYSTDSGKMMDMLQAMGVQLATAGQQMKGGIEARAEAEAAGANAAASRETDVMNRDNKLLDVFNINPNNPGSALIDGMDQFTQQDQVANKLKPQVDALMAINPMTDPLTWVAAQVQLTSLVPQYNAAIQNRDRAAGTIATRQQLDAQQKTLTPASTIETIQNEKASKVALAQAQATIDKSKVDQDMMNTNIRYMQDGLAVAGNKFQASVGINRMMLDKVGITANNSLKTDEQKILDNANVIRLGLGQPPLQSVSELKSLPKDQQDFLINTSPQAMDPGAAASYIYASNGRAALRQNSPVMEGVIGNMVDRASQIVAANLPVWRSQGMKQEEMQKKAFSEVYNEWYTQTSSGDMTKTSVDNPYRMRPQIYAMAPGLEDNSIAKFVRGEGKNLPTLQNSGGEREVMAYAVSQVNSGRDADAVAADMYNYFKLGGDAQRKQMGLSTLGFDPRTQQMRGGKKLNTPEISYGVNADIFGGNLFGSLPFAGQIGGSKADVQMLNQNSIKGWLVLQRVKSIQSGNPEAVMSPATP